MSHGTRALGFPHAYSRRRRAGTLTGEVVEGLAERRGAIGNRPPSASFSKRPSVAAAAASSVQVSFRRRGRPVTGLVPA